MIETNAFKLLARVMSWSETVSVEDVGLDGLQFLAGYKYDYYQRFGPGRRFVESLALWLLQFTPEERSVALEFVTKRLVFVSDDEFSHLVDIAYQDVIVQERRRLVADELGIPTFKVTKIAEHRRSKELTFKSLFLGLSDGARTNELRRASAGEIGNEQIWQAYELSDEKADDMTLSLAKSLKKGGFETSAPRFNLVWLVDDFSASGNTYIRFDPEKNGFKGKIKKIYERLAKGDLVDREHFEVYLILYVATRQAIDHIEYWSDLYTSEHGYKPLQVRVVHVLEDAVALHNDPAEAISKLINEEKNYDTAATDEHIAVGGTADARWGFAACALPVVLAHNTPNNSVYILWGYENFKPRGLFPRVSRHREF